MVVSGHGSPGTMRLGTPPRFFLLSLSSFPPVSPLCHLPLPSRSPIFPNVGPYVPSISYICTLVVQQDFTLIPPCYVEGVKTQAGFTILGTGSQTPTRVKVLKGNKQPKGIKDNSSMKFYLTMFLSYQII